jgi:CubicO group peptidase (beta-lactamase class C family)
VTDDDLMLGFPSAPTKQVTLANWRKPPFNKWAFQHTREIVPTVDIPNDPDAVWTLPSSLTDLSALTIETDGTTLGFDALLGEMDTDGLVILHRGKIVNEVYATGMTKHAPHILMSVSKSVLGIMIGILVDHGHLVPGDLVSRHVPEIAKTAYSDARLLDLLDMRVGVHFDEDYLATEGPIIAYRKAQGWDPIGPGETPSDLRSFLQSLIAAEGAYDGRFHYVSPNTDLLGWVIERATGARYADLVSELLWRPMGASRSAYITVDRLGAPRCAGGLCVIVQDLARLGQLIVQRGRREGAQIISEDWIEDILKNGDAEAWKRGDFAKYFPGMPMHYRRKWYVLRGDAPMMFCVGVNGQNLFVDRNNELVIAKVSSQAAAMDERRIYLTMQLVTAIRKHFIGLPA